MNLAHSFLPETTMPPALPVLFGDGGNRTGCTPQNPTAADLQAIIASSSDAILVVDPEGTICFANPAAGALLGRSPDSLRGDPFGFPVAPGHAEIDILPPRAAPRVAEMRVTPVTWRGARALLAMLRDVTERKQTEQELRLAARVFDNATEGLLITDRDNRILKVNHAFTEITGFDAGEINGESIQTLLDSEETHREVLASIQESVFRHGRWEGELAKRRRDGTSYIAWTTVVAVRDEDDEISHFIAIFNDITEWKTARDRLDHLAHIDPLTELPNRTCFYDKLAAAIARAPRQTGSLAVLFVDLDQFKPVNDTRGHAVGDMLLRDVARRLNGGVREGDVVARLGGDEFIVLLPDLRSAQDAAAVARKIIRSLGEPFQVNEHRITIGASVGIALYPRDGRNGDQLVHAADAAMYMAKEHGGGTYAFHEPTSGEDATRH